MTTIQKVFDIAKEKGIDAVTLKGQLELLGVILGYSEDHEKFMADTFSMLEDETIKAWNDICAEPGYEEYLEDMNEYKIGN